jgi:hypothetical protein
MSWHRTRARRRASFAAALKRLVTLRRFDAIAGNRLREDTPLRAGAVRDVSARGPPNRLQQRLGRDALQKTAFKPL